MLINNNEYLSVVNDIKARIIEIVQSLTAQLTWTHSNALLDKIKDRDIFFWYAEHNSEEGWKVETLICI